MKRCPLCQNKYLDEANFCPVDAGKLESYVESAERPTNQLGADPDATGRVLRKRGNFEAHTKAGRREDEASFTSVLVC